ADFEVCGFHEFVEKYRSSELSFRRPRSGRGICCSPLLFHCSARSSQVGDTRNQRDSFLPPPCLDFLFTCDRILYVPVTLKIYESVNPVFLCETLKFIILVLVNARKQIVVTPV